MLVVPQASRVFGAPVRFLASRPGLFVVLAFLIAVQNTYASTLVASLFLARVGAQGIPFYYVLFAVVSVPVAAVFSSVIDRFPRPVLFTGLVGLFTLVTIVLAFVLTLGDAWSYVAFLAVRVSEHMILSVFYILFADYFTVTEAKRCTGRLALGMAAGGLCGGALLTALTGLGGPFVAAGITPALVAAVLAYGGWMTKRQRPLDAGAKAARESVLDSLRIIPRLLGRYPLVALMSAAMFLNILLQCLAEFSAFSIYSAHFPRVEDLAGFLGIVNAGLNVLGFLTIVLFTERQLPRLGVPKMNRVYPALDIAVFALLALAPSLPVGILANAAYDPFERGIDVPVATMNYNAIRYRFVGRVRVFIDGMMFPSGLATAGLLLMLFQGRLDLRAIAGIGLLLSAVLLLLHWNVGREYARGLVEMLRDGAVDLETVESGLKLPPEQAGEIRAMLAGDARTALLGLQMAVRCDGAIPADEIGGALVKLSPAEARGALAQLVQAGNPGVIEGLAERGPPAIRQLVWERVLASAEAGAEAKAKRLLDDADPGLRSLAAARVLVSDPTDKAAAAALLEPVPAETALGAIGILRQGHDPALARVLAGFGGHPEAEVRAAGVEAAAALASADPSLPDRARQAMADPAPAVRRAAVAVLARISPPARLGAVASLGFGDAAAEVRLAAVAALGARGEAAAAAIAASLHDDREDVQLAAVDALGLALGARAGDLLFDALDRGAFAAIPTVETLARSFPRGHRGWPAVRAATDNARRRVLRLVLQALDALGHHRTLGLVRQMMTSPDERSRANAIESLASLPQRRFVIPVLPLLEPDGAAASRHGPVTPLLERALDAPDPWLRAAAVLASHAETGHIPAGAADDPAPVVAETARRLAQRPPGTVSYTQDAPMSRLAFLHEVPLFAEASLDDLVAVDRALGSETYLAGEAIVTEGEPGDRLCIVHRGEVLVRRGGRVLATLAAGDFFGEMALFDAEPRSATVTAIGDAEILALERDRFHSLVQQRPTILMRLCTTLVRRLRTVEQAIPAAPPLAAAD